MGGCLRTRSLGGMDYPAPPAVRKAFGDTNPAESVSRLRLGSPRGGPCGCSPPRTHGPRAPAGTTPACPARGGGAPSPPTQGAERQQRRGRKRTMSTLQGPASRAGEGRCVAQDPRPGGPAPRALEPALRLPLLRARDNAAWISRDRPRRPFRPLAPCPAGQRAAAPAPAVRAHPDLVLGAGDV